MHKRKVAMRLITILLFILLSCGASYAKEEAEIYSKAVEAAKSGEINFAFMHFRSLLANYPASKYRESALFASGEYYFLLGAYRDAIQAFLGFLSDYPDSRAKPFVLMYLLKIAQRQQAGSLVKDLQQQIVTLQQLSFLFRNSKEYKYQSPLYRKHRVVYYIDKVEFYIEGELFAQIPY